jgi:murein hydrolase activator
MEADPGPLLLLHPDGPLGTARSGMILADVTPACRPRRWRLKAELQELPTCAPAAFGGRDADEGPCRRAGARTALSQAISTAPTCRSASPTTPRPAPPLLESADTLDAFAAGLSPDAESRSHPSHAEGPLPLPVLGTGPAPPGRGRRRGRPPTRVVMATQPRALVTAPWPATIRYRGPLLDYGNVMILEPGDGYLLVLAGLERCMARWERSCRRCTAWPDGRGDRCGAEF